MPDNLSVGYNASYTDVSLTKVLGVGGTVSTLLTEMGGVGGILQGIKEPSNLLNRFLQSGTAKEAAVGAAGKIFGSDAAGIAGRVAKQIVNPQLQLIYHGVGLREFQLNFVFTPKSSYEAEVTKLIIDTLVFYSSIYIIRKKNKK